MWLLFVRGRAIPILQPAGLIAGQQRNLLFTATVLMLVVVVPVFVLAIFIALRYREGNKKAAYTPDWDHHAELEFIWWALPFLIILTLSFLAWRTSHDLDPYRSIRNGKQPLTIQVVALQWKWLFIYPEQRIATVNYLKIPENTPINFQITADAPMNSFWIPQLGGQVYAMAGMSTKLHLLADHTGSYRGSSANISGDGFAQMNFMVEAMSDDEFAHWARTTAHSSNNLSLAEYTRLATPSSSNTPASFVLRDQALYDKILMKYMGPGPEQGAQHHGGE